MALFGSPDIAKLEAKRDVKGLINALRYSTLIGGGVDVRARAAEALGRLQDVQAVEPLIALVNDGMFPGFKIAATQAALHALGEIGDSRAAGALITVLRQDQDPSPKTRFLAAEALDKCGWQPGLTEESAYYWIAKQEWGRCVPIGAAAVLPLIQPLFFFHSDSPTDYEKNLSEQTLAALKEIGQPAVGPLLEAFKRAILLERDFHLKNPKSGKFWSFATKTLSRGLSLLGHAAVELLILELNQDDVEVRQWAAQILGASGDSRAVEPLINTLTGNPPEEYLAKVAKALGCLKDRRAVEPLLKLMPECSKSVCQEVIRALGNLKDPRAVEPLIQLCYHETDPFVVASAAEVLGKIGDPRAVDVLIWVLGDIRQDKARPYAARALGAIGDLRAVDALRGVENTTSYQYLRSVAGEVLEELRTGQYTCPSICQLAELCLHNDILYSDELKMISKVKTDLPVEGEMGSRELAKLIEALLDSRNSKMYLALEAAQAAIPLPDLLAAIDLVRTADPVTGGYGGLFPSELRGVEQVGWTDSTYQGIIQAANQAYTQLSTPEDNS